MVEFIQANAAWLVLVVMFVLMMRMHGSGAGMGCCGGGQQQGAQTPERDQDGNIITKDPVCDMAVTPKATTATSEYKGKVYYFCSDDCKGAFEKNPEKFAQNSAPQPRMLAGG